MNQEQFNEVLVRIMPKLKVYCLQLCNYHKEDAEDLVQTTLMKALSGNLRYDDHPGGWIFTIAKNEHVNNSIRKTVHASHRGKLKTYFVSTSYQVHSCDLEYYEKVLKYLSNRKGDIFLKFTEGYTYVELAELEQVNVSIIKNRMHGARTEFAAIIK